MIRLCGVVGLDFAFSEAFHWLWRFPKWHFTESLWTCIHFDSYMQNNMRMYRIHTETLESNSTFGLLVADAFFIAMCLFISKFSGWELPVPSGQSRLCLAGICTRDSNHSVKKNAFHKSSSWVTIKKQLKKILWKHPLVLCPHHCKGKKLWIPGYHSILILVCAFSLDHLQARET